MDCKSAAAKTAVAATVPTPLVIVRINAFWMQNSSVNDSSTPFVLAI